MEEREREREREREKRGGREREKREGREREKHPKRCYSVDNSVCLVHMERWVQSLVPQKTGHVSYT